MVSGHFEGVKMKGRGPAKCINVILRESGNNVGNFAKTRGNRDHLSAWLTAAFSKVCRYSV